MLVVPRAQETLRSFARNDREPGLRHPCVTIRSSLVRSFCHLAGPSSRTIASLAKLPSACMR